MIEITPAILTNDPSEFSNEIEQLLGFDSIDIDVIRSDFIEGQTTLSLEDVNKLITKYRDRKISWGFHFMVKNPSKDLNELVEMGFSTSEIRVYMQQESDLDFMRTFEWPETWRIGISLKLETELKNLEYYSPFDEVQLMSVKVGFQGGDFQSKVFEKVNKLRELGYKGFISLDGGVNLETAELIKKYLVNRVSVGSYFSKTDQDNKAWEKLDEVLN